MADTTESTMTEMVEAWVEQVQEGEEIDSGKCVRLFVRSGLGREALAKVWEASKEGRDMGKTFDRQRFTRALALIAHAQHQGAQPGGQDEASDEDDWKDLHLPPLTERAPIFADPTASPAPPGSESGEGEGSEEEDPVSGTDEEAPPVDVPQAPVQKKFFSRLSYKDFYPQAQQAISIEVEYDNLDATLERANQWLTDNAGLVTFVSIQTVLIPETYLPNASSGASLDILSDIARSGAIVIYPSQDAGYRLKTFQVVRVWYHVND